jgi:hypothetical protein
MLSNRKPTEIATDIYFLIITGLMILAFLGSIPLATTQSEVMALGLFYVMALTGWFVIYRVVNRGTVDEYS